MDTARRGIVLVAAVGLLLAGCGGQDATAPAADRPSLAAFDPPLAFGERIWLGDGYQADAFHIDAGTLYTYRRSPSEITIWDLATGDVRERVPLDLAGGAPRESRDGSPYAFAQAGGRVALLVAFEHYEAGVGTQPSQDLLRVQRYYADDGSLSWSQDVADAGVAEIRIVVASSDHTVVVTGARDPATERAGRADASVEGATTVLDTTSGAVRQVWSPFIGYAIDRDVVAGLHPDLAASPTQPAHTIEGRHIYTGETVWDLESMELSGADYFGYGIGGGAMLQPARGRGTRAVVNGTLSTNLVLAVATGEVLLEIEHDGAAVACRYDGEQILVCVHDPVDRGEVFLAAYDLHARALLWDRDGISDGRDLPHQVSAVYRGVVYMAYSSSRRPVALDARTGADLAVDLPVAPDLVGPGYGLAYEELGHISIYPATG